MGNAGQVSLIKKGPCSLSLVFLDSFQYILGTWVRGALNFLGRPLLGRQGGSLLQPPPLVTQPSSHPSLKTCRCPWISEIASNMFTWQISSSGSNGTVGASEGPAVGGPVGPGEGTPVGPTVGCSEGRAVGGPVGHTVGGAVGWGSGVVVVGGFG